MSDIPKNENTAPRSWLIRKRGYYYRPNRAGYTASVDEAGRYTEAEAKAEAALEPKIMSAIPLSDVETGAEPLRPAKAGNPLPPEAMNTPVNPGAVAYWQGPDVRGVVTDWATLRAEEFRRLETLREKLQGTQEALREELADARDPRMWSVAEVLEHLETLAQRCYEEDWCSLAPTELSYCATRKTVDEVKALLAHVLTGDRGPAYCRHGIRFTDRCEACAGGEIQACAAAGPAALPLCPCPPNRCEHKIEVGIMREMRCRERCAASTPTKPVADRCYVCHRTLSPKETPREVYLEDDDQRPVFVGPDCWAAVKRRGARGYSPPKGGPRLFASLAWAKSYAGGTP